MIDNPTNNVESGSLLPYMVIAGAAVCVLHQLAQCVSNCVFGSENDGDNHLFAGQIPFSNISDLVDQIEEEQHRRWEIEKEESDRVAAQFILDPNLE